MKLISNIVSQSLTFHHPGILLCKWPHVRVCVCVGESVVDLFSCCTYMQLYQIANNRLAGTSDCVLEMNKNYSFLRQNTWGNDSDLE